MRFKINGINQALTFATLILLLTMLGCSGGGSGNSTANTTLTGVFLDSPVSGLGYETRTHQGITGTGGAFSYQNGEAIRFFIDCVEGAVDETHPMVTNMLLFLQSIDFDNDPENGIDIAELMHHEAIGMHLDFAGHPEQFRESYDFRYFLDLMSSRGMFHDYEDRVPPEIVEARNHMRQTMMENGLHGYGPNGGGMFPHSGNDGQQPTDNMGPGSNGGSMGRGPYSGN
jgi:hypothetical protein